MAMMGGLDCIAMAVEHLERRSSSRGGDGRAETAPPPPPTRSESPGVVSAAQLVPARPPHFFYGAPRGHFPPPPPQSSSFLHQPRVVTDAADVTSSSSAAPAGPGAAFVASEEVVSPDDAKHIEDLRRLIFQVDLFEWKNLPGVDEKEVITKVTHADVLCGRGGETNHHKGNITFRACVKACQPAYIEAKRREKPYIAQRIVVFIRRMGGRFLKREGDSLSGDAWKDVGNNKAREKTSQALREGAPELRGDVKEMVSTATSAPSLVYGSVPYVHDRYYEYGCGGPVPEMVTVTSAYDAAVLSAPVGWHSARSVPAEPTTATRRPSKKQKRRESHYAKAAETVLAHCPRPTTTVVPVVSENSLTRLDDPRSPAIPSASLGAGASERHPSPSVPGTPRVTISSDEEERSSSSLSHSRRPTSAAAASDNHRSIMMTSTAAPAFPTSVVVSHSGPRLKLLKKRILSTDS